MTALTVMLPLLVTTACSAGHDPAEGRDSPASEARSRPQPAPQPAGQDLPRQAVLDGAREQVEIASDEAGRASPTPGPRDLLPLATILALANRQVAGEIIDVDLDDRDGVPQYEVKVLTARGRKIEMRLDARDGRLLELEDD